MIDVHVSSLFSIFFVISSHLSSLSYIAYLTGVCSGAHASEKSAHDLCTLSNTSSTEQLLGHSNSKTPSDMREREREWGEGVKRADMAEGQKGGT